MKAKKDIAAGCRLSDCPHPGFIRVRINKNSWCAEQHLLYFLAGNAMLAAFGPIAAVPIKPCKLHKRCVHRCEYKCNALSGYEATPVRLRSRRSGSGDARAAAKRQEVEAKADTPAPALRCRRAAVCRGSLLPTTGTNARRLSGAMASGRCACANHIRRRRYPRSMLQAGIARPGRDGQNSLRSSCAGVAMAMARAMTPARLTKRMTGVAPIAGILTTR